MGRPQQWQRKRGDAIEGPIVLAQVMLEDILAEIPRCALLHRLHRPEAIGRTQALLERVRAVRAELAKLDWLKDELREDLRILTGARRAYKHRNRKGA